MPAPWLQLHPTEAARRLGPAFLGKLGQGVGLVLGPELVGDAGGEVVEVGLVVLGDLEQVVVLVGEFEVFVVEFAVVAAEASAVGVLDLVPLVGIHGHLLLVGLESLKFSAQLVLLDFGLPVLEVSLEFAHGLLFGQLQLSAQGLASLHPSGLGQPFLVVLLGLGRPQLHQLPAQRFNRLVGCLLVLPDGHELCAH